MGSNQLREELTMRSINTVAIIVVLAGLFSAVVYITKNNQMASMAVVAASEVDQEEPNRALCDQLIRFGQVAFDRGQFAEAKHFFQKAITVDPRYPAAWRRYNMALLAQISAKVQTDTDFLPEFSSGTEGTVEPVQISPDTAEDEDDGC
jgi:Tfp pilus assembly protein PilF